MLGTTEIELIRSAYEKLPSLPLDETALVDAIEELAKAAEGEPSAVHELCERLRAEGTCAHLVRLCATQSATTARAALLLIGNIASDAVDTDARKTRSALRQAGGTEHIARFLWSADVDTLIYAAGALMNLATTLSDAATLKAMGALPRLTALAGVDDESSPDGSAHEAGTSSSTQKVDPSTRSLRSFASGCLANISTLCAHELTSSLVERPGGRSWSLLRAAMIGMRAGRQIPLALIDSALGALHVEACSSTTARPDAAAYNHPAAAAPTTHSQPAAAVPTHLVRREPPALTSPRGGNAVRTGATMAARRPGSASAPASPRGGEPSITSTAATCYFDGTSWSISTSSATASRHKPSTRVPLYELVECHMRALDRTTAADEQGSEMPLGKPLANSSANGRQLAGIHGKLQGSNPRVRPPPVAPPAPVVYPTRHLAPHRAPPRRDETLILASPRQAPTPVPPPPRPPPAQVVVPPYAARAFLPGRSWPKGLQRRRSPRSVAFGPHDRTSASGTKEQHRPPPAPPTPRMHMQRPHSARSRASSSASAPPSWSNEGTATGLCHVAELLEDTSTFEAWRRARLQRSVKVVR
jgi:hypothetical protein